MADPKTVVTLSVGKEGIDESKEMEMEGSLAVGEIARIRVEGLPESRLSLTDANAGLALRVVANIPRPAQVVPPWTDVYRHDRDPGLVAAIEPGGWTRAEDGALVATLNMATVQAYGLFAPPQPPPPPPPRMMPMRMPPPPPPRQAVPPFGGAGATMLLEFRSGATAQSLLGSAAFTLLPWPPDAGTSDLIDLATGRVYSKAEVDALLSTKANVQHTHVQADIAGLGDALAGKADLVGGKVPSSQLPSYVDDVLEFASRSAFPATGEAGKIYVALDTNKTYRWSGSEYVQVGGGDPPVLSVNGKTGTVVLAASDVGAAPENHTHASITDGDTTVSAVNGGAATITKSGLGNASATFPDGFSITYYGSTYTAPSGGETIEFVGPYSIGRYAFWVPTSIPDPESFDPVQNSVWCLWSSNASDVVPQKLMFETSCDYYISDWNTANPSLTLNNGEASGGAPTMARTATSETKTVATEDKIPSTTNPLSIANGGTGATTAAAARANLGAMDATADGNTILTGGTTWDGAPIGTFADQVTRSVVAKAALGVLAERYSDSRAYEAGDVVSYGDSIYECTASTPSPAGEFDPNSWRATAVARLLDEKQDTIPDLAAIRSGAAAGATAVQPSALPASETWTFTVDDGQGGTTTVTKNVAVYAAQGAGA